ncbi:MAG: shikimate kinase [Phycisphaerales bacterium]|nr:shikimate kinase [Phycisphaerales bacterium]
MNFLLVGARGSGKSTVGPLLAARLGWPFLDLDEEIVKEAGSTIHDIFANEGEEGFRQRERAACQKLRKIKRHVVALGGGVLTDPDNRNLLKRIGKVIWLRAPAAVLWSRINKDPHSVHNRPNLTAEGGLGELESILAEREPQYQASAHHIIDTMSISPTETAEAIEIWYQANDAQSH